MKKILCPLAILAVIGAAAWWLWDRVIWGSSRWSHLGGGIDHDNSS